jgi:hypothetical protein
MNTAGSSAAIFALIGAFFATQVCNQTLCNAAQTVASKVASILAISPMLITVPHLDVLMATRCVTVVAASIAL